MSSVGVFTVGVTCDIGVGPAHGGRERNEDNYLVCYQNLVSYSADGAESRSPQAGTGLLAAVCDGMGGHADGDIASTTAAKVLAKLYQPGSPHRPAKVLLKYVLESHRQLHWAARQDGPVGMGTTLTAIWLINGQAAWTHVGDSRLYLHRNRNLLQLTRDHTRNEFARRDGRPTTPDGDHLVQTFIYGSRGLGDNAALRLEQGKDSGAEMLHAGDRLLLCSDGMSSAVSEAQITRILSEVSEPQEAAEQLRDLAKRQGSRDNITVIIIRVDSVTEPEHSPDDDPDDTVQY